MKRLMVIAGLMLATVLSAHAQKDKKFLPKELKKVEFGMSMAEVQQLRPNLERVNESGGFRRVLLEEFAGGDIQSIVYYFDNEGDIPLYEIIINYRSASPRDQFVAKKWGERNFADGEEWFWRRSGQLNLTAWTYQNKAIIVGLVPNCEWDENSDGFPDQALD